MEAWCAQYPFEMLKASDQDSSSAPIKSSLHGISQVVQFESGSGPMTAQSTYAEYTKAPEEKQHNGGKKLHTASFVTENNTLYHHNPLSGQASRFENSANYDVRR